ncbi:unnamed protein product [Lampetra planeri]
MVAVPVVAVPVVAVPVVAVPVVDFMHMVDFMAMVDDFVPMVDDFMPMVDDFMAMVPVVDPKPMGDRVEEPRKPSTMGPVVMVANSWHMLMHMVIYWGLSPYLREDSTWSQAKCHNRRDDGGESWEDSFLFCFSSPFLFCFFSSAALEEVWTVLITRNPRQLSPPFNNRFVPFKHRPHF